MTVLKVTELLSRCWSGLSSSVQCMRPSLHCRCFV